MSDADIARREPKVGSRLLNVVVADRPHDGTLHPAWRAFLRFCADLQHGEVERLKIQDGLPVLAEIVTKKVKFVR